MVYVLWGSSIFLIESRALKGEGRLTYWCMLAILYSLFSILPSFSSFSFSVFSYFCCDTFLEIAIIVFL